MSTRPQRRAALAKQSPPRGFTSLDHHRDPNGLVEASNRTRKDGAPGVDGRTAADDGLSLLADLESRRGRAPSGTYRAPPVRRVRIPQGTGNETRPRGIPPLEDKVLQRAVGRALETIDAQDFRNGSSGFRPGRSAHQALRARWQQVMGRGGCWSVAVDSRKFLDDLDQDLVRKAVRHHDKALWVLRYSERWPKAPVQRQDGSPQERTKGSPQGAVVSPLRANLCLQHAFDNGMRRKHPSIPFERSAEEVIVHAKGKAQAEQLLEAIRARRAEGGRELHPEKTRIVSGQDSDRKGPHAHIQFDLLGSTCRPRRAKDYRGKPLVSFLPGVRNKAGKALRATIRGGRLAATRNNQAREGRVRLVNPAVRGGVDYYGRC